jgi:hypothetical protein
MVNRNSCKTCGTDIDADQQYCREHKPNSRKNYQFVSDLATVTITLTNDPSEDDAWEALDEIVRNTSYYRLESVEEI